MGRTSTTSPSTAEAPDVYRLRSVDGGYELRISTKLEPIRDTPRAGWMSDWIPVTALPTGRRLDIKVGVGWPRIATILGRTEDGVRHWGFVLPGA